MKFEINNLKAYVIMVFSMLYASYTSALYLNHLLGNLIVSYVSAIVISVIAHLYLMEGVTFLKQKQFSASLLIALMLCGTLAYFDLSGVSRKATEDNLIPLQQKQEQELSHFKSQMRAVENTIMHNANHTSNGKTNWAMYGTFTKSSKQLQEMQEQLAKIEQAHLEQLGEAKKEAHSQKEGLTGLSIALLVLSTLISFTMGKSEKKASIVENNLPERKDKEVYKMEVPTVERSIGTFELSEEEKWETSTAERIELASEYIKKTNETNQRKLSDMFRLNFGHVKQAKIMANAG